MPAGAPSTRIVPTANIEVSRARPYTPAATRAHASPTRSERPDGANRSTSTRRFRGNGRTFSPIPGTSPPRLRVLPGQGRELELAEEDDFVLELDAVLLPCPATRLGHQRNRIFGARLARVLDEVRVPWRDHGAADPESPQTAGLEHPPSRQLVLRVLEDAPIGALVRRLRGLAPGLELGNQRLDVVGRTGSEAELDLRDDLAGPKSRTAIAKAELVARAPARILGVDDERTVQYRRPVAAVGAGVHPHPATGSARNRARELEPTEPSRAGPMECDRVRRAAAGHEELAMGLRVGQHARKLQDETIEAVVGNEEVRAEPHDGDREFAYAGVCEELPELVDVLGPRKRCGRSAGPERG